MTKPEITPPATTLEEAFLAATGSRSSPSATPSANSAASDAAWLVRITAYRVPTANREDVKDACSYAWEMAWTYRDSAALINPTHLVGEARDNAEAIAETAASDEDALLDSIDLADFLDDLTDHQRAIALLYSFGFSYKQIAAKLGLSYTAVSKALVKIKDKGQSR